MLNVKHYSFSMSSLNYVLIQDYVSVERNTLVFYQLRAVGQNRYGQCAFVSGHVSLLTQVQALTHAELTLSYLNRAR